MINMIHAELKRLLRSKGFYIMILIYFLTYCFSMYFQIQSQTTGAFGFKEVGFVKEVGLMLAVNHKITTLNEMVQLLGLNYGLIIFGIYFTIFVCDEYNSGYIKNTVILPKGRYIVPLSKMWVALVYSLIFVFCNYLFSSVLGFVCIDGFTLGSIQEILIPALAMFMIVYALMSLVSFLSSLTHSKLFSAAVIFLILSGAMMGIIYPLISIVSITNLNEYTLSYFCSIVIPVSHEAVIKIVAVSFLYIVIYNVLSVLSLIKREI